MVRSIINAPLCRTMVVHVFVVVAVLIIAASFLQSRMAQANLIAFYQFEGNANDASGNGNNGTIDGATLTSSGFTGSAFEFDGTDDFVEIPVDINPSVLPQMTMGAWVNSDVADRVSQVISHDNGSFDRGLGMDTRSGGGSIPDWSTFTGSGILVSGVDVTVGDWVFLAVVYDQDAATVRLHVNDLVFNTSGTFGSGSTFTRIGMNPGFGEFFDGRIDNVFIFNEALSESRINEIRNDPSSFLGGSAPAPTLITNGSFEIATVDPGAGFIKLGAGSTVIDGWVVESGTIDLVGGLWQASDGSRSIDMNGTSGGSISQTFATEIGKQFKVLFDMAGNPDSSPNIKELELSTSGSVVTFMFDTTGKSRTNMGYEEKSFIFTATDTTTTLTFRSLISGNAGPVLDNVRVSSVTTPTPTNCPKDGDVDLDGEINIDDVLLAFDAIFDPSILSPCQRDHADIDDGGDVTINDVICIFDSIFGIPCNVIGGGGGGGGGRSDNEAPTLDRIDVTRFVLSHGRVDVVRPISVANPGGLLQVPGFPDNLDGTPGLLTTIANEPNPLLITLDTDDDGEPDLDNPIILAAATTPDGGIPSCFTLAVAEGLADPDGDPVGVRWEAPDPRFGAGNVYATVDVPNPDPDIDIFAGMELVTPAHFEAYTANSIVWEAPDVGFVIVDSNLDGGTENITARAIDFPPQPLNSKFSPTRFRNVGFADPLDVNIVEGCKVEHPDGSFSIELLAEMPNTFDPLGDTWFRWAFEGKTTTIVKDVLGSPIVEFDPIPAEEADTLGKITVVASSKGPQPPGVAPPNPFVQQPPEQSVGNDTFVSVGCTLSDTESVPVEGSDKEEICDDGVDNDCDGAIDEDCATVRIYVEDSGNLRDDVFRLIVDGQDMGVTPEGKGREYDLDFLGSGEHTVVLEVIKAPDDIGTFTIRLLGGMTFLSRNGSSFAGTSLCPIMFLDTSRSDNQGPDDCSGPIEGTTITYKVML